MDFRIQGKGGLKFHSQRHRNILIDFGGIHGKSWGISLDLGSIDSGLNCGKSYEIGLSLGPSGPWLDCVKHERQGDGKFLKDSDGFWMAFQVRYGCDWSAGFGVITVWWGWRWFNLWIPLVVFGLVYKWDPMFMLVIWHRSGWLKEIFVSTMSKIEWYMQEVLNLVGFSYVYKR